MGTLDLLIVNPGAAHGIHGNHPIYGELGTSLVAVEPPLWCRLIAGYIQDRGYRVRIIDAEAERLSPWTVGMSVRALTPRLVCIAVYGHQPSASTQQMDGAGALAREIKKLSPDTRIIMVGGHVAALPERTLNEEHIDFACNGEGPLTIYQLLQGEPYGQIAGLVWHDKEKIYTNKPAPLIEDLDRNLHGDVWDMLPMHLYRAHNWQCFGDLKQRQPYASIYTSLGCPYKCSFCCINAPFDSNRYRMRSPAAVVQEIRMLHANYGVSTFKIVDEMFVLNYRHVREICEGLIASGIADKLNIWAYARVDTVRANLLPLLRRAGFRWLALGIESGSAHVRDGAEKSLRNDDIIGVVRAIQSAGINVIGNYIFGLRDDDVQTMQETLRLALECRTEFANFYSAMAYPGSRLYAEAVEKGWTLPASWRGYSQHNADCRPLDTEHVDAKTVLAFRDSAFNRYFSDQGYLDLVEKKFGTVTLSHVMAMTEYKLHRNLLG